MLPAALVAVGIGAPLCYIKNKSIAKQNTVRHLLELSTKIHAKYNIEDTLFKYFKSNSIYILSGRSDEEVLGAIKRICINVQSLIPLCHDRGFIDSNVKECMNLVRIYLSEQKENPSLKFDESFAESETIFLKNLSHRFNVCIKWKPQDFDFALKTCKKIFEDLKFLNLHDVEDIS